MKQNYYLALYICYLLAMIASCNLSLSGSKLDLGNLKGYKCFGSTGIPTPVRLTASGDIECFSLDGRDCSQGFKADHECRTYIAKNILQANSLVCSRHDYKTKGHWCRRGFNFFYRKWHCPNNTGLTVAIRLRRNFHPQCLSLDSKTCLTGEKAQKICQKANHCRRSRRHIKPIELSKTLKNYQENPWYKKAFAYFRYTGDFQCKPILGFATIVRISKNGNVQCLTNNADGKTCITQNSLADCTKSILKETEGGSKKPATLSCGDQFSKHFGKTGFEDPQGWCTQGFNKLFSRVPSSKFKLVNQIKKGIKKRFIPKWFIHIKRIIKNGKGRSKKGLEKIKEVLTRHKFDFTGDKWKNIKIAIQSGKAHTPGGFHRIIKDIKNHTPGLKKIPIEPTPPVRTTGQKEKPIIPFPHWWKLFIKFIMSLRARTPSGIKTMTNVIKQHGGILSPRRWKWIIQQIKTGRVHKPSVLRKVLKHIKKKVPVLKKIIRKNKEANRKLMPNWWRRIKVFIRTPRAKTPHGLQLLKKVIQKHGGRIPGNRWKWIKHLIVTGKVNNHHIFKNIIKRIKARIPILRRRIMGGSGAGIYRRPKWFIHITNLLKKKIATTPRGITHIKSVLKSHGAKIPPRTWKWLVKVIKSGKVLKHPNLFKKIVKTIIKKVPGLRNPIGGKGNPYWLRRIKDLMKKPISRTPKGLRVIKKALRHHGFQFTIQKWRWIKKQIKSGNVIHTPAILRNVIAKIKKNIPSLQPHGGVRPEWYHKLINFFNTPLAKTKEGIKKVKHVLDTHGLKFPAKNWHWIKIQITNGNFSNVAKKIRHNIPKVDPGRGVTLKLKGGKKCGTKFFRHLKALLKKYSGKAGAGLPKIKHYMNTHFKVTGKKWQRIKASILAGTLHTVVGRKQLVHNIKNHIPIRHLHRKHWTKDHWRRFRSRHGKHNKHGHKNGVDKHHGHRNGGHKNGRHYHHGHGNGVGKHHGRKHHGSKHHGHKHHPHRVGGNIHPRHNHHPHRVDGNRHPRHNHHPHRVVGNTQNGHKHHPHRVGRTTQSGHKHHGHKNPGNQNGAGKHHGRKHKKNPLDHWRRIGKHGKKHHGHRHPRNQNGGGRHHGRKHKNHLKEHGKRNRKHGQKYNHNRHIGRHRKGNFWHPHKHGQKHNHHNRHRGVINPTATAPNAARHKPIKGNVWPRIIKFNGHKHNKIHHGRGGRRDRLVSGHKNHRVHHGRGGRRDRLISGAHRNKGRNHRWRHVGRRGRRHRHMRRRNHRRWRRAARRRHHTRRWNQSRARHNRRNAARQYRAPQRRWSPAPRRWAPATRRWAPAPRRWSPPPRQNAPAPRRNNGGGGRRRRNWWRRIFH